MIWIGIRIRDYDYDWGLGLGTISIGPYLWRLYGWFGSVCAENYNSIVSTLKTIKGPFTQQLANARPVFLKNSSEFLLT